MNTSFNPISVNDDALTYNLEDSTTKLVETDEVPSIEETTTPITRLSPSPSPSARLKKKIIPFWTEDPNILVKPAYMMEFFPIDSMSFNQKLNSITRTVVVLTAVSYLFTNNTRIVSVAVMTIFAIFFLHYAKSRESSDEGFHNDEHSTLDEMARHSRLYNYKGPIIDVEGNFDETFDQPTASNPLSNVLLTDYDYNPKKKPAPPAFTKQGVEDIAENAKKMVQEMHPDQPDIVGKLYNDINTNLEHEQSMRQFYSTSNTTIPNDQAGFAEFCYGDMISAKEGNKFALTRDNPKYDLR